MERFVGAEKCLSISLRNRVFLQEKDVAQARRARTRFARLSKCGGLEGPANEHCLGDLVWIDQTHAGSHLGNYPDQPLFHETPDRVADRSAADAELSRQVGFGQESAWGQPKIANGREQLGVDTVRNPLASLLPPPGSMIERVTG